MHGRSACLFKAKDITDQRSKQISTADRNILLKAVLYDKGTNSEYPSSKGEDTRWNISFRLFHETQFNAYFIIYDWISGNPCKYVKRNPSRTIISKYSIYIFSKNTTKQKTKRKKSIRVTAWLKNRRHASAFNNICMQSWWLMRLKNQYCFLSLFISCLIEQTGCLILYRVSSSFHRAIPEDHKDVEGFTTDTILLTATLVLGSVQYY